jgi:superfamily I DNA/RNA helicase
MPTSKFKAEPQQLQFDFGLELSENINCQHRSDKGITAFTRSANNPHSSSKSLSPTKPKPKRRTSPLENAGEFSFIDKQSPSSYQADIFAFVENGTGHGLIEAAPGSSKTTTLLEAARRYVLKHEGKGHLLFVAFSRQIATELKERIRQAGLQKVMRASTIHALGLATLYPVLGKKLQLKENKYNRIIQNYLVETYPTRYSYLPKELAGWVEELIHYARVTLTDPREEVAVRQLCQHYGLVEVLHHFQTCFAALGPVLIRGQQVAKDTGFIDYNDMLYLPLLWQLPLSSRVPFDLALIDEYQDLSAAQLELLLRLLLGQPHYSPQHHSESEGWAEGNGKESGCLYPQLTAQIPAQYSSHSSSDNGPLKDRPKATRLLFAGDQHQSIFGFNGADDAARTRILARTSAQTLPLRVCYRCPTSHIALANQVYPVIEPAPGAAVGQVHEISQSSQAGEGKELASLIKPGDLVMCRVSAPLVSLCFELIRIGQAAKVLGRDIGKGLVAVLNHLARDPTFRFEQLISLLENYREVQRELKAQVSPTALAAVDDKVDTLIALYEGANPRPASLSELKLLIEAIFSDEQGQVVLSTVHRAKGLQFRRAFILHYRDLLPHPKATLPWERVQEHNLKYVALTRATEELFLISPSQKEHTYKHKQTEAHQPDETDF